ncbi:MAG: sulfite exporter TauE/SafE family protein [Patescibacteria group bacterium]
MKEHIYYVKGMHCASCEILIEKKLLELKGIESVEASADKGEVIVESEGEVPETEKLNGLFKKEGYIFSESSVEPKTRFDLKNFFINLGIGLLIIVGFVALSRSGLSELVNTTSKSSLPVFFFFGLVAGLSSCAALVGGLILSMSKQWDDLYSKGEHSFSRKMQPHLIFNSGRIISYVLLGALLGAIGSRLQISLEFTSILVIAVSLIMVILGLQMLGIKALSKFQITMPRIITRKVADESNFKGRYMPFLMGALTFFLPCGFTITAQGMALISGSAIQGGLIMLFFVLGTLPMLLFIGFSSVKFAEKPHLSSRFLRVAGVLVLFFAFFNINNQLNVLGAPNFNSLVSRQNFSNQTNQIDEKDFPPIVNGKQILKMNASASGYTPNYFKVKAGIPVRWEITDKGTSGCTNAVISRNLFDGQISLTPGQTSVKEFTPTTPGKYKFSCWMGMISGTIEVINTDSSQGIQGSSNGVNAQVNGDIIPSGATGCGCGGGGSGSCSISK